MKFANLGRQRTFLVLFSESSDWETMLHDLFQAGVITHAGGGERINSFSEFSIEILDTKDWDMYQIEAIKRCI